MVELNDEVLGAFIDGELDQETSAAVAALAASNPQVRERLDALRASDTLLRAAFPLEPTDVPELTRKATISPMPIKIDRRPSWRALAGASIAAALAGFVLAGPGLTTLAERERPFALSGGVANALETATSGAAIGDARVVTTLKAADGRYCREFEAGAAHGLACRTDGAWELVALGLAHQRQDGYRTAGAESPIDGAIERLAGEPLDPAVERTLVARRWRD